MNTIGALVRAGLGVGPVPEVFASGPRPHAVVRPLTGPAPVLPHHAVWSAERLPPAAEQFLNITREVRDANM